MATLTSTKSTVKTNAATKARKPANAKAVKGAAVAAHPIPCVVVGTPPTGLRGLGAVAWAVIAQHNGMPLSALHTALAIVPSTRVCATPAGFAANLAAFNSPAAGTSPLASVVAAKTNGAPLGWLRTFKQHVSVNVQAPKGTPPTKAQLIAAHTPAS